MKYIKLIEEVDPFRNNKIRMKNNYKPNYRQGLIAVHFKDDEFKKIKSADYFIDYQQLMNDRNSDFRNYFENKYNITLSDYRQDDNYYFYFTCEPGKEKEKLEEISKDKTVKDVDFVDLNELKVDELREISDQITSLADDYSERENEINNQSISDIIERLKKLL